MLPIPPIHRFSGRALQIAIHAYAACPDLPRVANGAILAPSNSPADAALITAGASIEIFLGRPRRALQPADLAMHYLAWLAQETSDRSADQMLKLTAYTWYSARCARQSDALALTIFARMLCHALNLAFDPACRCFCENALLPSALPAVAIAPVRDAEDASLLYVVYWQHAPAARVATFAEAQRYLADAQGMTRRSTSQARRRSDARTNT